MPKISELTAFTDLADADTLVAVDGSTTKKITAENVAVYTTAEGHALNVALDVATPVDGDAFLFYDVDDDLAPKVVTAANLGVYMSAEHVAAADPHTQYPKLINTDSEAGRTIYVGSVDPDVSYTPVDGDVWIDTSA